jgi:hypothetical protein
LADSHKNLLSELLSALLRLIAQHGQLKSIEEPTVEPSVEPSVEPTIDTYQYTIQADRNRTNNAN